MPITSSAKKRVRLNIRQTVYNRTTKRKLKDAVRAVREAITKKDKASAEKALPLAYKQIDIACKKHVLHRNTAARRKSGLARMVRGI